MIPSTKPPPTTGTLAHEYCAEAKDDFCEKEGFCENVGVTPPIAISSTTPSLFKSQNIKKNPIY